MDINWSTFFLEIINFLVLVWLLKRFFYKPIKKAIDERQQNITKKITEVEQKSIVADQMKETYKNRLASWEREKQLAREALNLELNSEKVTQLEKLKSKLVQEKEKIEIAQIKSLNELKYQSELQALKQGALFTSQLLKNITSKELELKLIETFIDQLGALSEDKKRSLFANNGIDDLIITVTSAYPLNENIKEQIGAALHKLLGKPLDINHNTDQNLIAGVRVNLGDTVLRANLLDELQFFSESFHVEQ